MADQTKRTLYDGKHIRVVQLGKWEFVERRRVSGIVGIVAVTDDGKLLLVEQERPPVGARVIELPAGLAGDVAGSESEELATAASRELLEETGYRAERMEYLCDGAASAGLSNEIITLFRAVGLTRVRDPEGDGGEQITLHAIPLADVIPWIEEQKRAGLIIDLKVYAGLYFAQSLR